MNIRGISAVSGGPVEISTEDGRLSRITDIPPEENLPYVSPGFFDIQVNGYMDKPYLYLFQ